MKAKIRKTGEIVDVISYSGSTIRNEYIDKVSYIDSKGVEHERESLNYYWDFEQIPDVKEDNFLKIDWEQRRYEIAREILPSIAENILNILQSGGSLGEEVAGKTVAEISAIDTLKYTDALIEELKKGVEQ